jgi:catechol 2,3-dioxygenase-like lactoylglutathione lyase family enzyme
MITIKIDRLDHLVITVKDIEKTCDFYCNVLGMEKVIFGEGRMALHFGEQKINLHRAGNEYEPKANVAKPGTADLCFITNTPITEVMKRYEKYGIPIEVGPIDKTGAKGELISIYTRDPDGNLIEVSNYK